MRSWNLTDVGIPNCVPEYFREKYETEEHENRLYQDKRGKSSMKLKHFLSSANPFIYDNTIIWVIDENEEPLCPCGEWYTDWFNDYEEAEVKKLTYEPEKNRCEIIIKAEG